MAKKPNPLATEVALDMDERLAIFLFLRERPTKDGDERKKRKTLRACLHIDKRHVLLVPHPAAAEKVLVWPGRYDEQGGFQREKLTHPARIYAISKPLAEYLSAKMKTAEYPDDQSDTIADIEEKLDDVITDRYEVPEGLQEAGADEDYEIPNKAPEVPPVPEAPEVPPVPEAPAAP